MRYLAIIQNAMYGPADEAELARWAAEGRIYPNTVLEEDGTGRRTTAGLIVTSSFATFQQTPRSGNIVLPRSGVQQASLGPMQPIPPQMLSNYRRPDDEPPLFLAHAIDGKRELIFSFILALAAPIVAIVHSYGIVMAIGGVYIASLAIKRGRKLGFLSLVLNIVAVPAALFMRFIMHGFM